MNSLAPRSRPGYTALCAEVLFPLHERLKRHDSVARLRDLEDSQWWSAERLEAYRVERLRGFLERIGASVPYYAEVFKRVGFEPAALRSVAELRKLPFLTKAVIRAHADALKANDAIDLSRYNTGGSSGEPLVFYIGRDRVSHDVAAKWRATRWWDVDVGDREIVVWGSPIELGAQDWIRGLRDTLLRTSLFRAFELTDTGLQSFVDKVRRERPAMLFGYPSVFARIAAFAAASSQPLDRYGVRVVFVTSERLYPDQREAIQTAFGCPVAYGYGGRDG